MTEAYPSLEEILFDLAVQKPTAAERAAFLAHACRDNPALRATLEKLLESHFGAPGFLTQTVARDLLPVPGSIPPSPQAPAQMLGRYKLLAMIGEGGFGEVWMAEQREPVKRRVAIKILKLGMDSRQVVARFEAERQALAMMDHANIARILDADMTDAGRPYFVMELVRGIRITDYCDQNHLPTRERLELFIKVCQAIQHAHQKGIIHRDIKPSNILVTLHDGVPVPKVIDFGIAKATQGDLTDKTVFTQFQQFMGTPAYISPEQAAMTRLDIDTRSDIYSLGVLLYELLTGTTPFDTQDLLNAGFDGMRRMIRETEPEKPSTRLTQRGRPRPASSLPTLHSSLATDLDWIVMKCLEKDRSRRYETANGLAADIRHHLADEPITARPPSTTYQIQKAWQRNKLAFSAAAAVVFALLVGTSVSTWQAVVATRARSTAQQAERLALEKEREAKDQQERADREATAARHIAYVANLGSIQTDWNNHKYARVRETLASQRDYPKPSFEWFYWQRMTHLEVSSFATYAAGIKRFSLSPDRTKVVLVMGDDSIEIRSLPSGEKLASFVGHGTIPSPRAGHEDLASGAVFSPDARCVASVGGTFDHGVIKLWDAQTGKEIRSFGEPDVASDPGGPPLPEQSVGLRQYAIAFSTDGRFLASGGAHGKNGVQLWEVGTGRKIRTLEEGVNGDWITQVAFSSDGRRIFSYADCIDCADSLRIHDARTGQLLDAIRDGDLTGFDLSPDFQRMAVCHNRAVRIYDLTAQGFSKVLLEIPSEPTPREVSFSPDGRRLMLLTRGDATIHDSFTGKHQLTLRGGCYSGKFSADAKQVISTDGDRRIKIWDASVNRELVRVITGYMPRAISKDGSRLVVHLPWDKARGIAPTKSEANSGGLGVVDTATGKLISTMREHEPRMVDGAAFSPDNKWVASGGRDAGHTLRVWDARTGQVKQTISTPESEHDRIGFGPKGDTIVSTLGESSRGLAIWDVTSGQQVFSLPGMLPNRNWAMTAEGHRFAAGDLAGQVRVWDTVAGAELRSWQAHARHEFHAMLTSLNECMDYSADGRRLVTGGMDGFVKVWDPETGRLERQIEGYSGGVVGVHFTPDQRRLIGQGWDGNAREGAVRLWDPATGKELLSLSDPLFKGVWTWFVTVSPDGHRVFSAPGNGREVIIWEGATPEQVATWRRDEEADAALWASEQPKVEARRLARIGSNAKN